LFRAFLPDFRELRHGEVRRNRERRSSKEFPFRAWDNWRAGAWPLAIKPSAVMLTGFIEVAAEKRHLRRSIVANQLWQYTTSPKCNNGCMKSYDSEDLRNLIVVTTLTAYKEPEDG
jgi:hypothetical protein